ncbi:hypothetical protein RsTz2092_04440 [Deferribacterales bacterium RsTz2092]|nr:hypothetical protein AGMMS49941_01610 [Deferribacterales bacterium]
MPKFNDFDMENWKELTDIDTGSLWIIERRDNIGKHRGFYHGNFVPQIPRHFIKRFTKLGDVVLDPFMGSGTTAYECETLDRDFVGIDIKPEMIAYVRERLNEQALLYEGDSTDEKVFDTICADLQKHNRKNVQLVVLHPPYFDILKFSDNPKDLSNAKNLDEFKSSFALVVNNCIKLLENGRYLVVVIGDKYSKGQWHPLGFYCMNECMNLGLTLKSIIVKNMDGNRAKQGKNDIWRYRALSSDYYLFKHEYILLFKKG